MGGGGHEILETNTQLLEVATIVGGRSLLMYRPNELIGLKGDRRDGQIICRTDLIGKTYGSG
jgi:hypothetical protein